MQRMVHVQQEEEKRKKRKMATCLLMHLGKQLKGQLISNNNSSYSCVTDDMFGHVAENILISTGFVGYPCQDFEDLVVYLVKSVLNHVLFKVEFDNTLDIPYGCSKFEYIRNSNIFHRGSLSQTYQQYQVLLLFQRRIQDCCNIQDGALCDNN